MVECRNAKEVHGQRKWDPLL